MFELELSVYVLLTLVAAVAGCFDAIAGGGGLITVPALMLAGLDPVTAVATNKLQGSVGTVSAAVAFARRGLLDYRRAAVVAGMAFSASMLGAASIHLMPDGALRMAMPVLLIAVAAYFTFSRKLTDEDAQPRMRFPLFMITMIPLIGFYDGVFGPGAGSFYMAAIVGLLGYGVLRATALTKVANGASNLGGLVFFLFAGVVNLPLGLCMAVGAFAGAQVGSALAMTHGRRIIKPLIVVISLAMAARLVMG